MVNRVDLPLRAVHGSVARGAEAPRGDRGFAGELRRLGVLRGDSGDTGAAAADESESSETSNRIALGEKRASDPAPQAAPGSDRSPLGTVRIRRPILTGASANGSDDDPATPEVPRGPQSGDDEPIQLSSRGGYKNARDYTRDEGWTKHPDALYPDPAKPGYWIDPVTGRSGNFPPGYVPGMPLGDPGNPSKNETPSPTEPANDPLSVEMARLGMDPQDRLERMQFVASVDADMRDWLNEILEKRGMDPVEERPLEELSDDMASEIQERRDKKAQRAEVLADLAEGNGSVRGGPDEGTVPVFTPDSDETA